MRIRLRMRLRIRLSRRIEWGRGVECQRRGTKGLLTFTSEVSLRVPSMESCQCCFRLGMHCSHLSRVVENDPRTNITIIAILPSGAGRVLCSDLLLT